MPVGVFRVLSATVVVAQHWPIHQGYRPTSCEVSFRFIEANYSALQESELAWRI